MKKLLSLLLAGSILLALGSCSDSDDGKKDGKYLPSFLQLVRKIG